MAGAARRRAGGAQQLQEPGERILQHMRRRRRAAAAGGGLARARRTTAATSIGSVGHICRSAAAAEVLWHGGHRLRAVARAGAGRLGACGGRATVSLAQVTRRTIHVRMQPSRRAASVLLNSEPRACAKRWRARARSGVRCAIAGGPYNTDKRHPRRRAPQGRRRGCLPSARLLRTKPAPTQQPASAARARIPEHAS